MSLHISSPKPAAIAVGN